MLINVSDILAANIGTSKTFEVTGERPDLEDLLLGKDLAGQITVTKAEDGLEVGGKLATSLRLGCHRCLRAFDRPTTIRFMAEYGPGKAYPVTAEGIIDLAPLVREELIVDLPIKILHSPDCPGIPYGDQTKAPNQPRIKKGTK